MASSKQDLFCPVVDIKHCDHRLRPVVAVTRSRSCSRQRYGSCGAYTHRHWRTFVLMNPHKVDRARIDQLTDLPNVGKATASDLCLLGFRSPQQLAGECPFAMYERLCRNTRQRHDPCVIDVFMSVISFMKGESPRPWWEFTATRKDILAGRSAK